MMTKEMKTKKLSFSLTKTRTIYKCMKMLNDPILHRLRHTIIVIKHANKYIAHSMRTSALHTKMYKKDTHTHRFKNDELAAHWTNFSVFDVNSSFVLLRLEKKKKEEKGRKNLSTTSERTNHKNSILNLTFTMCLYVRRCSQMLHDQMRWIFIAIVIRMETRAHSKWFKEWN